MKSIYHSLLAKLSNFRVLQYAFSTGCGCFSIRTLTLSVLINYDLWSF